MVKKDEELPFGRIEALKKEIESLKQKKAVSAKSPDLMESMDKLTQTLNSFMAAFEEATEEMKLEEKEEELFTNELKPIHEKLDQVAEQNEKIAKGIIAVANMLNSDIPFIKRMVSGPMKPSFESPRQSFGAMPQPQMFSAPKPEPRLTGAPMPPPPKLPEKKSKFSELFK